LQCCSGYFVVCRITIGAQLEAAASLQIAQVAGYKILNPNIGEMPPRHWQDVAETYLKLPNIITARTSLVGAK
jgi:hypothetical protein